MPSKDGWTHENTHNKVTLGTKQYRNMEEWTRPCAVCAEKFAIYVRTNASAVNASFGLRTCKAHRGQLAAGPGSRGGTSRPFVAGDGNAEEINRLRAENQKLRDEVEMVNHELNLTVSKFDYEYLERNHKAQFEELQIVKARLAKYELGPAMAEAAKNNLAFPWQPS